MKWKNIWLFMLLMIGYEQGRAQLNTHQFEDLDSLQHANNKLVVVFIHTDWCKYCAMMEHTTFENKRVTAMLNNDYYFIDLNAEEKKTIHYSGFEFNYKPSGNNTGIHELAEQLGTIDNKISYPTLCFLNAKNEIVFQYNQFLSANDFTELLTNLKDHNSK